MLIVADENIPLLEAFFADLGTIEKVHGRHLTAAQVKDADVLLVRSISQVNEALLANSRVGFVASATIGTDHVDQTYLSQQGIGFASAPGCNADSVVDYVLSALLNLSAETGEPLDTKTFGIVGVGNVGSRLQQRLIAMGLKVLCCDPPRVATEGAMEGFVSFEELLTGCDVICLHTPLTKSGEYPSYHLLNQETLALLNSGSWLINAGRGGAIDNIALKDCLRKHPSDLQVVLDVWENEPVIDYELFELIRWGTPHIAGYSLEGRWRGTEMIYRSCCNYLGKTPTVTLDSLLPRPDKATVTAEELIAGPLGLVNRVYDLRADHQRLSEGQSLTAEAGAALFDRLRKEYPARRQYSSLELKVTGVAYTEQEAAINQLTAIGFRPEPLVDKLDPL